MLFRQASARRDLFRAPEYFQTGKSRLDDIVRVVGTKTLGQYVMDPRGLEYSAGRTTGDNARTSRGRHHEHPACAEMTLDLVGNRLSFDNRHLDEILLRLFH